MGPAQVSGTSKEVGGVFNEDSVACKQQALITRQWEAWDPSEACYSPSIFFPGSWHLRYEPTSEKGQGTQEFPMVVGST